MVHYQVKVPWLGRLPGDIHFKSGNVQVYIPLATGLLISLLLTLVLYLIRYLKN
jgi:hypothetical protein